MISCRRYASIRQKQNCPFCFTDRSVLQYDANRAQIDGLAIRLDESKPSIISSSVAGTGGGELRRGGARPGAIPCRTEPAYGRDRKRKSIVVDALGLVLGGRASADMVRSDTDRARFRPFLRLPKMPACRALLERGRCASGRGRTADRARGPGRRKIAGVSRQPACNGGVAAGTRAVPRRHSRPARAAATFLARSAVRVAGRIRRHWTSSASESAACSASGSQLQRELDELNRIRAGKAPARGFVELPAEGDRGCRLEAGRGCAT